MGKRYDGSIYLFAVAMLNQAGVATFTLAGGGEGQVEVIGEDRTTPKRGGDIVSSDIYPVTHFHPTVHGDGQFQDSFAGYGVHLYIFRYPEIVQGVRDINAGDFSGTCPQLNDRRRRRSRPLSAQIVTTGAIVCRGHAQSGWCGHVHPRWWWGGSGRGHRGRPYAGARRRSVPGQLRRIRGPLVQDQPPGLRKAGGQLCHWATFGTPGCSLRSLRFQGEIYTALTLGLAKMHIESPTDRRTLRPRPGRWACPTRFAFGGFGISSSSRYHRGLTEEVRT